MPLECCGLLCFVPAQLEELDPTVRLTLLALAAFSTLWVGAVGAAIGSFLNVVIYRLPLGISLLRPKSRCPSCGTPIRAGDNIPIFGWIRLRGRCRSCGTPISARYPLVEATTALLFLGLAHFELFSGGANLPYGPVRDGRGLSFVLWHLDPIIVGLFVFHATLLSALLCLSLIAWDGFPPPRRLTLPVIVIGLTLPIVLPLLHPVVSGWPVDRRPLWTTRIGETLVGFAPTALVDALTGLTVGVAIGLLLSGGVGKTQIAASDRRGVIAAAGFIGLYLGYQAAIACGLLAAVLALANAIASHIVRRSLPVTGLVAVTVLIQLPLWRTLSKMPWWPGPQGWTFLRTIGWPANGFTVTSLMTAAFVTAILATLAGRLHRHGSPDGRMPDGIVDVSATDGLTQA